MAFVGAEKFLEFYITLHVHVYDTSGFKKYFKKLQLDKPHWAYKWLNIGK